MTCVKCNNHKISADQFVGAQGQRVRTCQRCRDRAQRIESVAYNRRQAEAARRKLREFVPASVAHVTLADHPRKYNIRPDHGDVEGYDATYRECARQQWMIGADPLVNWCTRHNHKARLECDDCLREAAAWQAARRIRLSIEALAKLTEPEPVLVMTPRGAGGHKPGGSQFNRIRPKVDPVDLWIERR